MKFFAIVSSLATAIPLTFALPVDERAAAPRHFKLKSTVITGNANKNNLYLTSYHTGAATNVAVFTPKTTNAIVGHLNGTKLQFALGDFPYQLELAEPHDLYAGWGPTEINVGYGGNGGFSIMPQGHLTNSKPQLGFEGWRICGWDHGINELFHDNANAAAGTVPSSCAKVNLVAEYI